MPANRLALLALLAGATALTGCDKARTVPPADAVATSCTGCHGGADNNTGAPPRDTRGNVATTVVTVGAHTAHLDVGVECGTCHVVPDRIATPGHVDGTEADSPTVVFAGAALLGGGQPPQWDRTGNGGKGTCANTYCHGAKLDAAAGGLAHTPTWTEPLPGGPCSSCHGQAGSTNGAPLSHGAAPLDCSSCHPATVLANGTIKPKDEGGLHANGTLEANAAGCTGCHGDSARTEAVSLNQSAPPRDVLGGTSGARVGAHQAHLHDGALAKAFDCSECHVVPASIAHASPPQGLGKVRFNGPLGNRNATPTWNGTTCSGTYCHGGGATPLLGGTAKNPTWAGTVACGTCHFSADPPAPHPALDKAGAAIDSPTKCIQCHPGTVLADGTINVANALHVNGVKDIDYHPVGFDDPAQHGGPAKADLATCRTCHGALFDGGIVGVSCNGCHGGTAWQSNCTLCHGLPSRAADAAFPLAPAGNTAGVRANQAAPPMGSQDESAPGENAVGAHLRHVSGDAALGNRLSSPIRCDQCHGATLPAGIGHVDGKVVIGWQTAAIGTTPVITPAPVASAIPRASAVTCANYCHGATLSGGAASKVVSWAVPGTAGCLTCHALPPAYTAPSWHVVSTNCTTCHGYSSPAGSAANLAKHVNGLVELSGAATCTTCHGTAGVNAAPPAPASGGIAAVTNPRVGAHQAHLVAGPLAAAFACSDCHGALPPATPVNHADGSVRIQWSALAAGGGTPTPGNGQVPPASTTTCSSVYCHGATLLGGSNKIPRWTASPGSAEVACGTCHFLVPPAGGIHPTTVGSPAVAITLATQCATCHPSTVKADGTIDVLGGQHVNGTVDGATGHAVPYPVAQHGPAAQAGIAACTGCHGVNFDTDVGGGKSCNSCHANPAAYGYTGPAHASWATDCTFCHGDRTDARTDAAFPTVGTPSRSAVAAAPPEGVNGETLATTLPVGAHQRHYAATTAAKVQCSECHGATLPGATLPGSLTHMNGGVAIGWGPLARTGFPTPTPNVASIPVGSAAALTCANYCHGATTVGGSDTTPDWQVSATGACGTCHFVTGATSTLAQAHAAHTNNAAVLGGNYACVDCHATVVNAGNVITGAALHVNGLKTVAIGNRGTFASADTGPTCSSTYCHSSGQASPAHRTIAWTGAAIGCNGCHGTGTSTGAPDYASGAAGSATANGHASHTAAGATTCQNCHSGLVSAAGTAIAGSNHTNGLRDVVILAALDTNGATSNYDPSTKTCSSVSCHGTATPVWGGVGAALKCSDCHTGAADVDSFAFGTAGIINTTEWTTSGHGQTGAPFTGASALPTIAAGQPCLYCHDGSVLHDVAANPFRLLGATGAAGAITAGNYSAAGASKGNEVCLNCHGASGTGVNAAGQGLRTATNKTSAWHAGTKHGAASDGGTRCWDCHDPHGDANIRMVGKKVVRDATDAHGFAATRVPATGTVTFTANATGTDFAGAATRVCNVCHTTAGHYTSTASDTHNIGVACTICHAHDQPPGSAFTPVGGGEPTTAGTDCKTCHGTIYANMTGAAASKHTLGTSAPASQATDTGFDWSTATTLRGVPVAQRSCTSMCHGDHPHDLTAGATTHQNNLYANPTTTATRANAAATRNAANRTAVDFDPAANTGMCTRCHLKPVAAGGQVISDAAYGASAHDFTSTTTPAVTWEFVMHDASKVQRNCTKCHSSQAEGNAPSVAATSGVHSGSTPTLLAGTKRPNSAPANFVCYNCHGNGTVGVNRSNKTVSQDGAKARRHPFDADNVHDTNTELASAAWGNTLGVTGRHSSCLDCHDTHEARPGARNVGGVNGNRAGPALQGAWGAELTSFPATFVAPTSANFTKKVIVAGTDLQATLCFKCHSSYYWGAGAPPSGQSPNGSQVNPPETDVAMEFNPANASGHPVLAGLNSYTGNGATLKALVAAQMKAPWNTNLGTQTMSCTDCHSSDAAAPSAQGPHGSASQFMLKGANPGNWPNVVLSSGFATSWCANCHNNSAGEPHSRGDHSSRRCYECHIVVPHGGKLARLIGDRDSTTIPTRYFYNGASSTMQLSGFTKKATNSYTRSDCGAQCSTGDHPLTNGADW